MMLRVKDAAAGHALSWVYLALAVLFIVLQAVLAPTAAAQALEPGILIMSGKGAGTQQEMSRMSRLAAHQTVPLHGTMAAEGVASGTHLFRAAASCTRGSCSCGMNWFAAGSFVCARPVCQQVCAGFWGLQ